jgi:hypothetical protein
MGGRQAVFACFVASCAFLAYLFSVVTANAGLHELPVLKVTAAPRMAYAPANIEVVVIAKPDAKNRYLAVSLGATDSAFAGSSQRSLDGEQERGELARILYRDAPAGNYLVVVTLFDKAGKQIARREADVRRLPRF